MKILVLTKRYYTSKDLLADRYGRMFEIPRSLTGLGHVVKGIAVNYFPYSCPFSASLEDEVVWKSFDVFSGYMPVLEKYLRAVFRHLRSWQPDIILAGSDAVHVIFGTWLARRYGLPCVADLYDNYEAFGLTRFPLVTQWYRAALRRADGVSCVSEPLKSYVQHLGIRDVCVVENAVAAGSFVPIDLQKARQRLGLPGNMLLIGTAGALERGRGIAALTGAFERVTAQFPESMLVVAGARDKNWRPPRVENFIDLGVLPSKDVPLLFSALDLGVICNLGTPFGCYCYPQKYTEMIACGLPIIAAKVGVFGNNADLPGVAATFQAGDAIDLSKKLRILLSKPPERISGIKIPTWDDRALVLADFLQQMIDRRA